jgi:hypothetical protein
MSIENVVILRREVIPSPEAWQAAIRAADFDMEIDTDFQWDEFDGFLPCTYKDKNAGFELFLDELDLDGLGLSDEEIAQIGDRDHVVVLVTHSDFRELMTSMIAAAVLCSMTDGLLVEGGEPPFIKAVDAIAWMKKCEPDIAQEFESANSV